MVVHTHGVDVHCKYELLRAREPGGAHDCYEGSLAQRITEDGRCHVVGLDHQSYGESEGVLEGYRSFFWKVSSITCTRANVCASRCSFGGLDPQMVPSRLRACIHAVPSANA